MDVFNLDIRTLLSLLIVGNVGTAAALLAYRGHFVERRLTRRYLAGALLQALSWTLLYLRGSIPDIVSIQIGNALLFTSFALETSAIASVDGASRRQDALYAVFLAIEVLGFLLLTRQQNVRVATASIATIPPFALLARAMLRRERRSTLRLFIGLASLLYCAILASRAAVALTTGPTFGLMTPAVIQTLTFVPLFLVMLVGGIGFILLINERADALLRESEEHYRTLVERASEAIIIAQDEKFAFVNSRMAQLLGSPARELAGRSFVDYLYPEDRDRIVSNFRGRISGSLPAEVYDLRMIGAGGTELWFSLSTTVLSWKGRPATLNLLTDITSRKRSEEHIARLLREKELLLREVHHRIKNNLAVAMGMLQLQADSAGTKTPPELLRDASNRLQSLVQLYDLLHRSGSFELMSVREFLSSLVAEISAAYPLDPAVRFLIEIDEIDLDVGRLATLGIIVNEIVTNSLKHAFCGVSDPGIRIEGRVSEGRFCLSCADNGPGLPPGGVSRAGSGLGLQLIDLLAAQLGAGLVIQPAPGLKYELEFALTFP